MRIYLFSIFGCLALMAPAIGAENPDLPPSPHGKNRLGVGFGNFQGVSLGTDLEKRYEPFKPLQFGRLTMSSILNGQSTQLDAEALGVFKGEGLEFFLKTSKSKNVALVPYYRVGLSTPKNSEGSEKSIFTATTEVGLTSKSSLTDNEIRSLGLMFGYVKAINGEGSAVEGPMLGLRATVESRLAENLRLSLDGQMGKVAAPVNPVGYGRISGKAICDLGKAYLSGELAYTQVGSSSYTDIRVGAGINLP